MKDFLMRFGAIVLLSSCALSLSGGYFLEAYDIYGNLVLKKKVLV